MAELTIGGLPVRNTQTATNSKEVFDALAVEFDIDKILTSYLVDVKQAKDLTDLAMMFTKTDEVGAVVAASPLKEDDRSIQTARLRRAWVQVSKVASDACSVASTADSDTLDDPLPAKDLDMVRVIFWQRYRVKFPASIQPSDALLSRIIKEVKSRRLSLRPLSKVSSLTAARSGVKDIKILEGVTVKIPNAQIEDISVATIWVFLQQLRTLMLAYSIAGTIQKQGVTKPEEHLSNSADYYDVPLDIAMGYFFKTEERAMAAYAAAPTEALSWVIVRDEQERARWVEAMRNSASTLGEAIQQTMREREAMWCTLPAPPIVPRPPPAPPRAPAPPPHPRGTKRPHQQQQQQATEVRKVLKATTTGVQLCAAWNDNKCSEPCAQGLRHACNRECKRNRACGMTNHRSINCRNRSRV